MKAGIYARISSDPSGQRAGVERQRSDCEALCESRGWEVVDVYTDNDVSAFSGKRRPEYERLLADIESGRLDAVVAWHNDRLHRSTKELERFIDLVERTKVKVEMVQGGTYDLTTVSGRMTAKIIGSVAQAESEHKSERIRRKALETAQQGRVSGWQGYGVRSDEERAVVRDAARQVLATGSLQAVVNDLNRRGVPAPSNGGKPSSRGWSKVSLRRVLLSPRIAGLRGHQGNLYRATWEGAIDRDTWEHLGLLLGDPKRKTNRGVTTRSYLLAGMIYCGECGARMFARPKADGAKAYCCAGSRPGHQLRRLAAPVEDLVRDWVLGILASPVFRRELELRAGVPTDDLDETRRLTRQLAQAEERLARLEERYFVDGEISVQAYDRLRPAVDAEIRRLTERLTHLQRTDLLLSPDPYELWESSDLSRRRELVKLVVDRVVLLPARRGYNRFDPTKVRIEGWLPRLYEVGEERWRTMTQDERQAVRQRYLAVERPELERVWAEEDARPS